MEVAYEGRITENTYCLAELSLKAMALVTGLRDLVKTYWDSSERAPMAEINSFNCTFPQKRLLEKICLGNGFMIKKREQ